MADDEEPTPVTWDGGLNLARASYRRAIGGIAMDIFVPPPSVEFDIDVIPWLARLEEQAAVLSRRGRYKLADGCRRGVYELSRLADWLERLD